MRGQQGGVRFAPSPTGRFHVGNLRTAWISYEWARALNLPWVLRFEDIDKPRVLAGAQETQLADMAELGLVTSQMSLQSSNFERHWTVLVRAVAEGFVYPCFCSRNDVRRTLEGMASAPHHEQPLYSGHCRTAQIRNSRTDLPSIAWRFRNVDPSGGQDFIVARSTPDLTQGLPAKESFVPAYNWACAIDDHDGAYDLLVRAWDLSSVVAQQRAIHTMLCGWEGPVAAPAIFHASLVVQAGGERLEKRTRGVTLPELQAEGWTAARIIERFAASFTPEASAYAPERTWGEDRTQISIHDLGF